MGNKNGNYREVEREVVKGKVFKISNTYNSSIYKYINYYDEKYIEKLDSGLTLFDGKGMAKFNSSGYVYFKAKKCGSTKIILGNEYGGPKKGITSIKVKIKKNDGKTPIENIFEKHFREGNPIKICLVGDEKVGKTSLIRCFNGKSFNEIY